MLDNNGSRILVDYRTEGLTSGGGAVYSETMTDSKGGTHTFYYNAAGDLVRYKLVDPNGSTLERAISPTKHPADATTNYTTYDEENAANNGSTYPGGRYYLKYVESETINGSTAPIRHFIISYGIPDEYPTVFEYDPDTSSNTDAFFDEQGRLYKFRYEVPDSRSSSLLEHGFGTRINGTVGALDFVVNPETGAITNVYHVRLDENGNQVGNRKAVSISDTGEVAYEHPGLSRKNKTFNASYDIANRQFIVTQKESISSASTGSVVYWASFADDGSEDSGDDGGYTYNYGFDSNRNLVYIRIVKDAFGTDPIAEFTVDANGKVTEVNNATGDSFRFTYDKNTRLMKIERYNENTGIKFIDETIEYADHTTAHAEYSKTVGSGKEVQVYKYDADGRLIWAEINTYHSSTRDEKFQLWFKWIKPDESSSEIMTIDKTSHSNDHSETYTYRQGYPSSNGDVQDASWYVNLVNQTIQIKYRPPRVNSITQRIVETKEGDYLGFTGPSSTSYFDLSEYPARFTLPSAFNHDLDVTLAVPAPSHAVSVDNAAQYEYTVPRPQATEEHFLTVPNAAHTHHLAKLIGVPEYEPKRVTAYYRYVVVENPIPSNYELVQTAWRSDTATASFYNKYTGRLAKIVIDKYDSTDASQKLSGAQFVLYKIGYNSKTVTVDGKEEIWYTWVDKLGGTTEILANDYKSPTEFRMSDGTVLASVNIDNFEPKINQTQARDRIDGEYVYVWEYTGQGDPPYGDRIYTDTDNSTAPTKYYNADYQPITLTQFPAGYTAVQTDLLLYYQAKDADGNVISGPIVGIEQSKTIWDSVAAADWTNDVTKATVVTTDAIGAAQFIELEDGTYYLDEIEPPVGYKRITNPIPVYVDTTYAKEYNLSGTEQELAYTFVSHVPNVPSTILPPTGGRGNTLIYSAAGGLMILSMSYLLYVWLRKRKEAEKV